MQLSVTAEPHSRTVLEIELSKEDVDGAVERAGEGSTPSGGSDVDNGRAIRELIDRAIHDALDLMKLKPLAPVHITIDPRRQDGSIVVRAVAEVRPEVSIGHVREVSDHPVVDTVTDLEVDDAVERLRLVGAATEDVAGRTPRGGETAVIAVQASRDGVPLLAASNDRLEIVVGVDQLAPGFVEHLITIPQGGIGEFDLDYPPDYGDPSLAGTTVHFVVVVRALRRRVPRELDAAFLGSLGVEDEAGLRDQVRSRLEAEALDRARHELAARLLTELVGAASLVMPGLVMVGATKRASDGLPETLIRNEVAVMRAALGLRLVSRGENEAAFLASNAMSAADLEADLRPEAEQRLLALLVLNRVAEIGRIVVSDEDVSAGIQSLLASSADDSTLTAYLNSATGRLAVRSALRRERALDTLVDQWHAEHPNAPRMRHLAGGHAAPIDAEALRAAAEVGWVDPAEFSGPPNPLVGAVPEGLRDLAF